MNVNDKAVCFGASDKKKAVIENITSTNEKQTQTSCGMIKTQTTQRAQEAVVMPERQVIPDTRLAGLTRKWAEGWNEALDEVARLNKQL